MKFTRVLGVFGCLFFTSLVQAQFVEPVEVCKQLRAPTEITECNKLVEEAAYLDPGSVAFCKDGFAFSSDKLACMRAVKNKIYDEISLGICQTQELSSRRLQCLVQYGRPYLTQLPPGQCVKIATLESELKRSMSSMLDGDTARSYAIQTNLLRRIQTCSKTMGFITK